MQFLTMSAESNVALELYITALPTPGLDTQAQAGEIYTEINRILKESGACLMQERVFATPEVMGVIEKTRSEVLGGTADGVPPSWLLTPKISLGDFAGVQVHAIKCESPINILHFMDKPAGREMSWSDCRYLSVTGITPSDNSSLDAAARSLLGDAEMILTGAGSQFPSITRTWFWLGDILSWYDDFNPVRNKFFAERGMIRSESDTDMPASTGIGVFPRGGAPCALDFVSVIGPCRLNKNLAAAGNQDSAFKYGSAFSRVTTAQTPAGETVYVSGTAAINMSGATVYLGDAEAQIRDTIKNVRGVLSDTNCTDNDVVYAFAYCKTPEIEKLWQSIRPEVPWPIITVIADVCRDNLLFEVEATALRGAARV